MDGSLSLYWRGPMVLPSVSEIRKWVWQVGSFKPMDTVNGKQYNLEKLHSRLLGKDWVGESSVTPEDRCVDARQ